MKIVRYTDSQHTEHYGIQGADGVTRRAEGSPFSGLQATEDSADLAKRLTPITPHAIVCIGLNYQRHAAETGAPTPEHPVVFFKLPGAAQHPGDPVVLPRTLTSHKVDYESELAVVIGKRCKNVAAEDALDYVLGYTCANDISARDWQKDWGGGQWCRGKMFDTFCPLGPCLVTPEEIPDPNALKIRTVLNGETMQDDTTADMIFNVPTLIAFLSGSTTLEPGTVILTGTPPGVGMARTPPVFLKDGDTVTVAIDGIGELTNPVVEEVL